ASGTGTPVGWVDTTPNQAIDGNEPVSPLAGETAWVTPTAAGLNLLVQNGANPAPVALDKFSNGTYYNSSEVSPASATTDHDSAHATSVLASAVDQSGNPLTATAPSPYAVTWTVTNTG